MLRAGSSSTPPSPAPPAGDSASQDDEAREVEHDLDALLGEAEKERDEYLDLAKRTKADFENFRKRMAAEVQAAGVRGKAALVGELVHVLDNLERALEAAGEGQGEGSLIQGIQLTHRDLCTALENHGVETVEPNGERFDPTWHEALTTKPDPSSEAGTVLETVQKGYRMGESLIRPARVVVSE